MNRTYIPVIVAASLGSVFVWLPFVGGKNAIAVWPTVLATIGFWALAAIYLLVRRDR